MGFRTDSGLSKMTPKMDLGSSKNAKLSVFLQKKRQKWHFAENRILDPKMTQNRRFWTPKWQFSGFSGFGSKMGVNTRQNGDFEPFLDPFLTLFGVILDPKIETLSSLSSKSLISPPNIRTHGSIMVRTLKSGSKMGVQNGSKIGGQK